MEPSLEQLPADEAFAKLPAVTVDNPVKSENKTLTKILTCHVVPGKREASDLTDGKNLKTVEGEELTVKNSGTLQCSGAISVTVRARRLRKM